MSDPDSTALESADNPTRERNDNEPTEVAVENLSSDFDDEYDGRNDVGQTSHEIRQHLNNDQLSVDLEGS
jgi:hypothetical protein